MRDRDASAEGSFAQSVSMNERVEASQVCSTLVFDTVSESKAVSNKIAINLLAKISIEDDCNKYVTGKPVPPAAPGSA